ncbi:LCP family protein [Butyrivibrio sp. AE3004]|uniref:LCP family protein n=1 Tax=Butyrivibrio sp. AE3004 TaxID=1506994 RepID=UPI00068C54FA|nr:LCP family protein [Butyrivibrio sp. AE3004]
MSDRRSGNSGRRGRKKNTKRALIIFGVEIVVLLILLFIVWTLFGRIKVDKVGKVNLDEKVIAESVNTGVEENEQMTGYTNLALFGVDSREGDLAKNTRSDTIMIASINNANGDIKLVSVYRDTYLNLSNDTYTKCNAAYMAGGPEQAISMLNMNLDMDITDFVTIGFGGLTDVIDELGGVEINIEENEITHLNNYQSTMAEELGKKYTPVTQTGMQTLDGLQATAYCRIRYTAGDDFRRAERQRTVLMAILEKAKTVNISELENVANKVFGETYTSLGLEDIIKLLGNVTNYNVVANDGFPVAEMRATGTIGKKGSCVIPVNLASNVKWLHEFLFEDTDYQVSSSVENYSQKIAADTDEYLDR